MEAVREILQIPRWARMHVKRMLNERYGLIDYQTMFWAIEESAEPREGMRAFMEKRPPNWIPEGLSPDRTPQLTRRTPGPPRPSPSACHRPSRRQ